MRRIIVLSLLMPGYGWVPADIVEADAPNGLGKDRWFSGLTVERLWLNQGRGYSLPYPDAAAPRPVDHMSIGYAEVDGKPVRRLPEGDLKPQLTRKIRFSRATEATVQR